uniref:C-type lectin domain-containing protein n=1 Tax=Sphaeramia orbicularis TaxID=375764 RepID=A0A673CIQ2_9TELE
MFTFTYELFRLYDMTKNSCENWMKFDNGFYFISTEQKTWMESRQECKKKGADLVIISGEEMQKFVTSFNKRVWIGLTDVEKEGVWKWVDGTTLNIRYKCYYLHQGGDVFVGHSEEDCAEIYVSDPSLRWNDIPCLQKNYWICERLLK